MKRMRVLVANEPRSYREALAITLQALRPQIAVMAGDPTDLDRDVVRFEPHLVVCSRLTETVQTHCLAWVLFYPSGTHLIEVRVAGLQLTDTDLELSELLAIIDHTERLAQMQ